MSTIKSKIVLLVILVVLAVILMALAKYITKPNVGRDILPPNNIPDGIACTMDAMMCPDGTYVGRSGPNCEFVCP